MNTEIIDAGRDINGGYKVDVSRGSNVDRVSSEWFSRLDDERYLSLDDLFASVKGRAERSRTRTVESAAIRVEAHRDNSEKLGLVLPGADEPIAPTHWSFGQLASLVGAPAAYLRQLPAPLAGINLQYGLTNHRAEQIKTLESGDGRTELRAVTGPDYGRIYDNELVSAVQRIAGNGTGDTRWKVPGVLDWSTGIYNPRVDITKDTTTLYASDRDVFLFLVDDLNPIEAGQLPDGSPDLYFRGFYCWNSEVGAKTLGIASFYLRAVCQNRNLWGVEDFQEIKIRHSKYAASRFAHEAAPALTRFANSSPAPFIDGIRASREKIVARTDEDREEFLRKRGFLSLPQTSRPDIVKSPAKRGSADAARRLWAMGQPISGTLAERYLAGRGLVGLADLDSLRFHPNCFYWREGHSTNESPLTCPALLAKVTDLDGRLTGLQRTWLNPATADKGPVIPPRKAMGNLLGNGVRIGKAENVLAVGEGLETMLSLHLALPDIAIVAALSANHLAALQLPSGLRRLYIAVDADPAGLSAADSLADRANKAEIDVIRLSPRLGDFNDDLRAYGRDELCAHLRPQLAPDDVATFLDHPLD